MRIFWQAAILKWRTLVAASIMAGATPLCAQPIVFPADSVGRTPADFEVMLTGGGPPPTWRVTADPTTASGRALAQLSTNTTDNRFPLAVYRNASPRNVKASVRIKAVAGRVDRAGGIAIRVQDANNYYVVRANALEDNVRFYRVVNGRREELKGANTKVLPSVWHELGLRANGDRFTVTFNGAELFTATDATFARGGRVALWTKADSVTHFDSLSIEELP